VRRVLLLAGALAAVAAAPLAAQELEVRAAAGVALPVSQTGVMYEPGPAFMVSLEPRPGGRWSLRLDGEWALLGSASSANPFAEGGDLRSFGVSGNALRRFRGDSLAPYLVAGLGAYRLQRVGGSPSPYGTTVAVQAGLGVDLQRWERFNLFAEGRAQLHLTDYGSAELSPTTFLPVVVGVRLR
jgi:hypothetical protein